MKTENESKSEWFDSDGKPLADSELIKVSKSWSATQWEKYLSYYEKPQAEMLAKDPSFTEWISQDEYDEKFLSQLEKDEFPALESLLRKGIKSLPSKQLEVIDLFFWQGKSHAQIGKMLKISKSAVQRRKERALKQLGARLMRASRKNTK